MFDDGRWQEFREEGQGMESMLKAIEAQNKAQYGENWRVEMVNERCWNEFRLIMAAGAGICIVYWVYIHLLLMALPWWTLPASLTVPAAVGWFWSLRDLR